MPRIVWGVLLLIPMLTSAAWAGTDAAAEMGDQPAATDQAEGRWLRDYAKAWDQAAAQRKMLLIFFYSDEPTSDERTVYGQLVHNAQLQEQLEQYVLLKVTTDAEIIVGGKPTRLLSHAAFSQMHRRPGLAIVDLAHEDEPYYRHVVSAFPLMQGKYYRFRPDHLRAALSLPPGTITQRTMVWAVRVHPENPQSTGGQKDEVLASEADSHSRYQARIGVQGHHNWGFRFHRILQRLRGRSGSTEVVAESWPNQNLQDACIDCVASWRQSPGHWGAVRRFHPVYGYDIKRGSNGVWYGTGIFAR